MSQQATVLLIAGAALFGVGLFTLSHRRDALGAVFASLLGFYAVACVLVGFSELAGGSAVAAQLQAFAVVAEVIGALFAAAGVAMAALLRRRTGAGDLLEPARAASRATPPEAGLAPGTEAAVEADAEPDLDEAEADEVLPVADSQGGD